MVELLGNSVDDLSRAETAMQKEESCINAEDESSKREVLCG